MKEQKETFASITAEFVGKPYTDTGIGPNDYNCIGFCYAFLKRIGKKVDDVVWLDQEINAINYMEWRRKDAKKTVEWLINVYNSIGREVSVNKKISGDFILWEDREGKWHPGIYGGNNQIMTSVRNAGIRVMTAENKQVKIVAVRRL